MTIKQLEYFMGVARHLNFSAAAKELFISQPSLSRSITALEEELGVRLFVRNRHNVELTAAGVVLSSAIPRLGAELSRVVAEVQQTEEGQMGRLRLGILDGLLLPDALTRVHDYFQQNLSSIVLHPVCLGMEDLITAVKEGTVDIIYTYDMAGAGDAALRETMLSSGHFCVAAREDLPLAQADTIDMKDLLRERILIACTENSFELHRWREVFSRLGFMPRFITVLNLNTLSFCIKNGYGIALLPDAHDLFRQPGIRRLELREVNALRYLIKWDEGNLNPCIPLFLEALEAQSC